MNRSELQRLRKQRGMSQNELATKASMNRSYYGLIETGLRNPTLPKAQRIATALSVDISQAFPNETFFGNKCYNSE